VKGVLQVASKTVQLPTDSIDADACGSLNVTVTLVMTRRHSSGSTWMSFPPQVQLHIMAVKLNEAITKKLRLSEVSQFTSVTPYT
jgi:hypothetical protein